MFIALAFAGVALVATSYVSPSACILFGASTCALLCDLAARAGVAADWRHVRAAVAAPQSRVVGVIAGLAALVSAALAIGVGAAYAGEASAPASSVTIPWGDWLGQLLIAFGSVFVALLTRAVALAPEAVRVFVTNDVITKAVDYAIATTRDAARGQTVSIQVSNQLIAAALAWVIANEPKIAKASADKLRPLIVARLSALGQIPAEATDSTLAVSAPATSV